MTDSRDKDIELTDLDSTNLDVPYDSNRISEEVSNMPYTNDDDIGREKRLFKQALLVCIVAFTITITSAVTGIAVGILKTSTAFLAFGCDGFVDIFAGIFIIWRFSGLMETAQQIRQIEKKETRASVGIAFALVLIGVVTAAQAIYHLVQSDHPTNDNLLFSVSGVLGGLLLIVSLLKFFIAHKLKSLALKESGITNISGFFLSMGVLIANGAYMADDNVWFLDATFAIIISFLLAAFGMHTLIVKRIHFWWKIPFWCPGEGDTA